MSQPSCENATPWRKQRLRSPTQGTQDEHFSIRPLGRILLATTTWP